MRSRNASIPSPSRTQTTSRSKPSASSRKVPRFAKGIDKQAAQEDGAQVAADLIGAVARKPSFPTSAEEQMASVFAALSDVGAIDAKGLADRFRKSKTTQTKIPAVLSSLARLGYVTSRDGETFALRRVA